MACCLGGSKRHDEANIAKQNGDESVKDAQSQQQRQRARPSEGQAQHLPAQWKYRAADVVDGLSRIEPSWAA
jgi:hypothetical protein